MFIVQVTVRTERHAQICRHIHLKTLTGFVLLPNLVVKGKQHNIFGLLEWRYNIQHNDIQLNDIQLNDIQLNDVQLNDIQLNDIQLNDIQLNDIQLNNIQLNDIRLNDIQHIINKMRHSE
jgi:hypothetical protein